MATKHFQQTIQLHLEIADAEATMLFLERLCLCVERGGSHLAGNTEA